MANDYEMLRRRHCAEAMALAPRLIERFDWPTERLAAHRQAQLRELLRVAVGRSPWHRRRLSHVDPATFTEAELDQVPVMTKDDLMGHFDGIVTDPRLRLDVVESHLEALAGDAYLLDRYHVVASAGSSGRRGVFVFGWQAWALRWLSNFRPVLRACAPVEGSPVVVGLVAAEDPAHGTSALSRTFSNSTLRMLRFPVTRPLAEIVSGLNRAQPDVLIGYPSSLLPLTHEARAGRLRVRPRLVAATGEPLAPEIRVALEDTWGVPVGNCWSTSEAGGLAWSCLAGSGMHLSDDLVVVEPVDEDGRPVPAGTSAAKVYLTVLYNPTLPLIRYELTDQVTVLDGRCPCGSAHRRIDDVQGRFEDGFVYGRLRVSPLAFSSPLTRRRQVIEYQVRQTPRGAAVAVRCLGPVDCAALGEEMAANLARLGLADPLVTVVPVDRLDRPRTGKLRRFVPLTRAPARPDHVTA